MAIDRCHGELGSGLGERPQVTIPFIAEFQDCKPLSQPTNESRGHRVKVFFHACEHILREHHMMLPSIECFPCQSCFRGGKQT